MVLLERWKHYKFIRYGVQMRGIDLKMLLALIFYCSTLYCSGQEGSKVSVNSIASLITDKEAKEAYEQILNETNWITGKVFGFAGEHENKSATALRVLLKHKKAKQIFTRLFEKAHMAGKLYALCGMYYAHPHLFKVQIKRLRNCKKKVTSISGDVHGSENLCNIVFSPYEDSETMKRVVLRKGQTLDEWIQEWIQQRGYRSYWLDISGGGYPSKFTSQDGWWLMIGVLIV